MIFISNFLNNPIADKYYWLTNYFRGNITVAFLKYHVFFRSHIHFSEHVGIPCSLRWIKKMKKRISQLEDLHKKAKEKGDFEFLTELEAGNCKVPY